MYRKLEQELSDIVQKCSVKNWDGFDADPITDKTLAKAISILNYLELLHINCPNDLTPSPDGCINIGWHWSRGDWKIAVEQQERYTWNINLDVHELKISEPPQEGDCLFFNYDARAGVTKKIESMYFNLNDNIPQKVIDQIREFEKWFKINDLNSIQQSLESLGEFKSLIKDRQLSYHKQKFPLDEFVVMGTWVLDSCGNCWTLEKPILSTKVVKKKDFVSDLLNNHSNKSSSMSLYHNIVSPEETCPVCKKGWSLDQCIFDIVRHQKERIYFHKKCLLKDTWTKCKKHLEENGKNYHMPNCAGLLESDIYIKTELQLAGINPKKQKRANSEVGTTWTGELKGFEFKRAWYYWMVSGNMPLELAQQIYENPIGQKDVRVAGHCGRVAPEDPWIKWISKEGKTVINNIISDKTKEISKPYVTSYHVDSLEGLKLLVSKINQI